MTSQPTAATCNPQPMTSATISELIALLKPRVMMLVVFTGLIGMAIAPGAAQMHPFTLLLTVLCIALGSGAGGLINMWYDRDIDIIMKRTSRRALPAGKVAADDVLIFGIILSIISVMLLGLGTNWVAAGWLAFAIFFYSVVYTMWLKRSTPQNIVIGGAAGAFPPIIGWVAMTGSSFAPEPWLLFAITFFWTPPHFWALALNCNEDYTRAGIPMLPVCKGKAHTVHAIIVYSLLLAAISGAPFAFGLFGWAYGVTCLTLNAVFLTLALRLTRDIHDPRPARRLFFFSIMYLFVIFAAVWIDQFI